MLLAGLFDRIARLSRAAPAADVVLLTILGFPAWRPLLAPGYSGGHDGLFHLFRLVELDGAIRAGVLYPRLAPNLALGYDYPVFSYYSPLSVYLAELFRLGGLGYADAVKVALGLSVVAAGWSMLLFARSFLPRLDAFLAALAYTYLPYLLVDVYVRGAIAEALALALLPLCLWAFRRLADRPDAGRIAVAGLSLAALLLAHNVTTLFFLPVLGAYWLFSLAADGRARTVGGAARRALGAAAAVALGLALAAFYWAPALFERDLVASGQLIESFFDYHEQFQPVSRLVQTSLAYDYGYDWSQRILFRAGLVQVALSALGCLAALMRAGARRHALFWGAVLAAGLALQTSRSAPLWEAVPLAAYVQFPWRLLALVGVASSVLVGYLGGALSARPAWLARGGAALLAVALLASALADLRYGGSALREENVRPWTIQRIDLDRKLVAATRGEYLPRWATTAPFDFRELPADDGAGEGLRLTVREAGPFGADLDVEAERPARVLFDRFYFPGWQVRVDGQPAPARPFGPLGLLATEVPAGEHRLAVWFGETPLRSAADAASVVGLLALAALALCSAMSPGRSETPRVARRREGVGVRALLAGAAGTALARLRRLPSDERSPGILIRVAAAGGLAVGAVVLGAGLAGAQVAAGGSRSSEMLAPGLTAEFGPAVRLAGAALDRSDGAALGLTLYWQARIRPARDYVVALRLLDGSGRVVGKRDKRPLFGLRATSLWEAGELVRDQQALALGPGEPAGEYDLVVGLVDARTGDYLRPAGAPATEWRDGSDAGVGVRLGRVRLSGRAAANPPPLAHASDARFDGRIALEGYGLRRIGADGTELPSGADGRYAAVVGQGERLRIEMRWRALHDLDEDYAVFTHLLDSRQQMVAQDDDWPQRGFYPTTLWLPGEQVSDEYEIQIPKDLSPGRYDLSVGLYRRADQRRLPLDGGGAGADRLSLGSVKVVGQPPLVADRLPLRRRLDASLGGEVTLLGYDLRRVDAVGRPAAHLGLRPGGRLAVTLYWQASRPVGQDYTTFVHLYAGDGPPKVQDDGQPASGNYPTTLWEAGEVVADRHVLDLGPDLPAGRYRLAAGMYLLQTGARLRLPSGEDLVPLEEIVVTWETTGRDS